MAARPVTTPSAHVDVGHAQDCHRADRVQSYIPQKGYFGLWNTTPLPSDFVLRLNGSAIEETTTLASSSASPTRQQATSAFVRKCNM